MFLNGSEVYQRALEPDNQRMFGLFHFVNATGARVRNIHYRGNWPQVLPPVAEQELATSPASRAAFGKTDLPHEITWNAKTAAAQSLIQIVGDSKLVTSTPAGLKINLAVGQEKPGSVGLKLKTAIAGDFEIVGVFSGLKLACPEQEPSERQPRLELSLYQAGAHPSWLKLERKTNLGLQPVVAAVHREEYATDRLLWHKPEFVFGAEAQRLKIARKGSVAYFLIAPHDSDDYRLLEQRDVGINPIEAIEFSTSAFAPEQGVEATLEELTIRTPQALTAK
ncbi:MAG: DUF1583 domain-containing protein [Planctomycetota bacterium]